MEQFKSFSDYKKTVIPMDPKFLEEAHQRMKDEVNKISYQNFLATGKIAGYIR